MASVDSGSTTTFYVDGLVVGTVSYVEQAPVVYLGNCSSNNQYIGIADEFKIWNSAFTEAQIKADMNTILQGTENGLLRYWFSDNGSANNLL